MGEGGGGDGVDTVVREGADQGYTTYLVSNVVLEGRVGDGVRLRVCGLQTGSVLWSS